MRLIGGLCDVGLIAGISVGVGAGQGRNDDGYTEYGRYIVSVSPGLVDINNLPRLDSVSYRQHNIDTDDDTHKLTRDMKSASMVFLPVPLWHDGDTGSGLRYLPGMLTAVRKPEGICRGQT
jgi:hypothetical protein